ncbi:MAG: glycosyltransferase [Chitinispirillales bacterium]|jgi:colanic acid/amylovoran biosynthesis glycosyltransferase|nr:glycosyltransferase [Chitinispirillales bacterium]
MLKICHFVSYYLPVTQNWIYSQLIHNKECEAAVLCQRLVNPKQFPFDNVHPICQSSGLGSIPKRLTHKIFERYPFKPHASVIEKFKPDIFHGHFLLESWRNYRIVKKFNIPLVTTCYGQDITSLPRKPFWAARCKKVFELSRAFIVEGEHMAGTLVDLGCPREKIDIIKLGIDTAKLTPQTVEGNNVRPPDAANKIKILFTGLNREKKGAVYAVKAFIKALSITNADLELHLLGDGIYREPMEKILTDAGVRQKVIFHGMRSISEYHKILGGTDLLLAPSIHATDGDTEGGAPVVVIEALCAGVPVVGSKHCDIPNIVSHGSSGLLSDERDVDALARDICILSENPPLRIGMGASGAKYARAEHDIAKQARKIADVYRACL